MMCVLVLIWNEQLDQNILGLTFNSLGDNRLY